MLRTFCDDDNIGTADAGEGVTHTTGRKQTLVPWVGGIVGEYYVARGTDVAMLESVVKYDNVDVASFSEKVNGLVAVSTYDHLHIGKFAVNLVSLVAEVKACGILRSDDHTVAFATVTT